MIYPNREKMYVRPFAYTKQRVSFFLRIIAEIVCKIFITN